MLLKVFLIFGVLQGFNAQEIQPKIIGGQSPPTVGKYPFIASLQTINLQHVCAGTIIDTRWVVTAASCIKRFVPPIQTVDQTAIIKYVGVGSDSKTSAVLYSVQQIFVHDYFDPTDFLQDFDIALVKTSTPIKYTATVKNIGLSGSYLGSGAKVIPIGWGITNLLGQTTNTIKIATLFSITNADCAKDLSVPISYNQLCATYEGKGACIGDLGSPVIVNDRLEGIVINEFSCGFRHDVYTRIYPLISWINTTKKR